jgi:hypothetical protein
VPDEAYILEQEERENLSSKPNNSDIFLSTKSSGETLPIYAQSVSWI